MRFINIIIIIYYKCFDEKQIIFHLTLDIDIGFYFQFSALFEFSVPFSRKCEHWVNTVFQYLHIEPELKNLNSDANQREQRTDCGESEETKGAKAYRKRISRSRCLNTSYASSMKIVLNQRIRDAIIGIIQYLL